MQFEFKTEPKDTEEYNQLFAECPPRLFMVLYERTREVMFRSNVEIGLSTYLWKKNRAWDLATDRIIEGQLLSLPGMKDA